MYHTHSTDAIYVPAWTTCTILHNKATKIPYLGPSLVFSRCTIIALLEMTVVVQNN